MISLIGYFLHAISSSDRGDYGSKNFKWRDYWYRNKSTNELIFDEARAKAGIYPNIAPYESLTPVGMQLSRFFSVVDAIANSSFATGTYLGSGVAGAGLDTRDGLTIAMGQLAQIGSSFMLPRAGISPLFGASSNSSESSAVAVQPYKVGVGASPPTRKMSGTNSKVFSASVQTADPGSETAEETGLKNAGRNSTSAANSAGVNSVESRSENSASTSPVYNPQGAARATV